MNARFRKLSNSIIASKLNHTLHCKFSNSTIASKLNHTLHHKLPVLYPLYKPYNHKLTVPCPLYKPYNNQQIGHTNKRTFLFSNLSPHKQRYFSMHAKNNKDQNSTMKQITENIGNLGRQLIKTATIHPYYEKAKTFCDHVICAGLVLIFADMIFIILYSLLCITKDIWTDIFK